MLNLFRANTFKMNVVKIQSLIKWIPSKPNLFKNESRQNRISSILNTFKTQSLQKWISSKPIPSKLNAFQTQSRQNLIPSLLKAFKFKTVFKNECPYRILPSKMSQNCLSIPRFRVIRWPQIWPPRSLEFKIMKMELKISTSKLRPFRHQFSASKDSHFSQREA